MDNSLSFIPLGGMGDVTKNMYLYEYKNEILIVDCGLGFADETMLGVDLLLPDVSYLLQTCLPAGKAKKKIVGMLLTHGHEDHIGGLPFVLPQLIGSNKNLIPIYGTPFAAALANSKLKEFNVLAKVQTVNFDSKELVLGSFKVSFIRVTHSVPDSANIFIKTPVGNFYHGSDFKFDDTPWDGKVSDYEKISKAGFEGVLSLMSDSLGAEREGKTSSEIGILQNFENEIKKCKGKFIVTTYSSHISRLNQIIQVSEKEGRKVVFIGRSLIKTKEIAQKLGYLKMQNGTEIGVDQIKNYIDEKITFVVAGSQGQENSAMVRITNGDFKEVKLKENDTVVFSSDPIPGNEVLVYELIDDMSRKGVKVLYSDLVPDFHVSGHGSKEELRKMIRLAKPRKLVPIGGGFRQMVAYKNLAETLGYKKSDIFLLEDGQEIVFSTKGVFPGRNIPVKNVYVDEVSGEEVESFVLRDRQKLSEGGIIVVLTEIDSSNGQLIGKPDIIVRGFVGFDGKRLSQNLFQDIRNALKNKKGRVINWVYIRRLIGEVSERRIFKDIRRHPLVLPVVIEV